MSVERVVDSYLQVARQLLGDPLATPGTLAAGPGGHSRIPDWIGDGALSGGHPRDRTDSIAATTGHRRRRSEHRHHVGNPHRPRRRPSTPGHHQRWGRCQTTATTMPQPLRDSTLITEGQQHIAQAMTLIAATSERYGRRRRPALHDRQASH